MNNKLIENSEISVVIQGPLYLDDKSKTYDVLNCINAIREYLPGAKIIVSTWEDEKQFHQQITNQVDSVIYSQMPAAIDVLGAGKNINRQAVSTYAGLQAVTTEYALKIRSNFILRKKGDFFYLGNHKINVISIVPSPEQTLLLFALPDFVHFGRTQDLLQLWDMSISQKSYYSAKPPSLFEVYSAPYRFRCSAEQYLGIEFVKKFLHVRVNMISPYDISYGDFKLWKYALCHMIGRIPLANNEFWCEPSRYFHGKFIPDGEAWSKTNTRTQYLKMLARKYIFCIYSTKC